MHVETIDLVAFRNWSQKSFSFFPGVTVIVGSNGAGKTVLLEAISVLSRGKSPRASQDKTMLQWGQLEGKVSLRALSEAGVYQQLEARFNLLEESQVCRVGFRLNDKPVKSRSAIIGRLPTVTFFANDLLLLRGSPENRRQFLDQAITQYDPTYFQILKRYQAVKTQKAALLKQAQSFDLSEMLAVLNQQLVDIGSAVITQRLAYMQVVRPQLERAYSQIADQQEILTIDYVSTLFRGMDDVKDQSLHLETTLETIQSQYAEAIERVLADEIRRGVVLIGPHRDDIGFALNGYEATEYASQGQQRSIVLAFKAAELDTLRQRLGKETPILLLDDVMAELDTQRQAALLSLFSPDLQVLMTTTHLDQTLSLLQNLTYHVIEIDSEKMIQSTQITEAALV